MPHSVTLITTLAVAFGLALVLGFVCARLKLPALVGYLLAGIVMGPYTPGFVADQDLATQLAEIGVMLLMFGVGLHFSIGDLMAVRRIALPGAIVQMAVATALGAALATLFGWDLPAALVFGLALSVASTVVLVKALEARRLLDTMNGRIAVGWLIVEDLAMVLALVLLPALAGVLAVVDAGSADGGSPGARELLWTVGRTLLQVALFVALMLIVGRRVFPWILWQVAKTGSRELFTLCTIAAALSIAFGSAALFGVSFALGAFFAGMVLRESEFSQRAAEESLPLQDAFAVLFFVSVGMLFDPGVLLAMPLQVLGTVLIIVLGKSLAASTLVLAMRLPLASALTISASLAQIGEFSFILAALGISLGLLPPEAQSLIVAGALISIALNPLLFSTIEPARQAILARSDLARRLEMRDDPLAALPAGTEERLLQGHVVLVGHGRVGRRIAAALRSAGVPLVVAEIERDAVEALRDGGGSAVVGNATDPEVLVQAHVADARLLVVAIGTSVGLQQMIETARTLNPGIRVHVRCHSDDEAERVQAEFGATVFVSEHVLAEVMTREVLAAATAAPDAPTAGPVTAPRARHSG
jgi:monovalent cation:H+ antiporter-2, CPA2 family